MKGSVVPVTSQALAIERLWGRVISKMVSQEQAPREYIQWMVHSLEAQERASIRMVERAAIYTLFSFTILGIYVGILFAKSDPISTLLLVGSGLMAGLFLAIMTLFLLVHRPFSSSSVWTLPHPRDFQEQRDLEGFPESIIDAYDQNQPTVDSDSRVNTATLILVSIQALVFLSLTLGEIFS